VTGRRRCEREEPGKRRAERIAIDPAIRGMRFMMVNFVIRSNTDQPMDESNAGCAL
jgi:hypothetical protein